MVTRAQEQASDFSDILRACGAEVIEFPTIKIVPPDSWADLDKAIDQLNDYDWLILTSVNGVKYFMERLRTRGKDVQDLKGIKTCAIGPKTAKEMEEMGIHLDFVPGEYKGEAVVEGLSKKDLSGKKVLLPRAEVARQILPDELIKMGVDLDVVVVYKTMKPHKNIDKVKYLLQEKKVQVITFTSSSTVTNFVEMIGKDELSKLIDGVVIANIGPITANTATKLGIKTDIMPKEYTIPALADAIVEYFSEAKN